MMSLFQPVKAFVLLALWCLSLFVSVAFACYKYGLCWSGGKWYDLSERVGFFGWVSDGGVWNFMDCGFLAGLRRSR